MKWSGAPANARLGPVKIARLRESPSTACGKLGVGVGKEQGIHGCDQRFDSSGNLYSNEDSGM